MPRVLVVDSASSVALSVIRSLGKRGIDIFCGESYVWNTGALSRYSKGTIVYPSPEADMKGFQKFMLKLVRENDFDLVIPISDFTTIPISMIKEDLERYTKVAVSSFGKLEKTWDKAKTIEIAEKCQIPFPKTVMDVNKQISYPAIIKPRRKVFWVNNKARLAKVTKENLVRNWGELCCRHAELSLQLSEPPLIQEYVNGEACGVEVLMNDGEEKAIFVHKRLREYPAFGGASSLRESVRDCDLAEKATRLLRELGWHGVAMVEFKEDKLMEINGRFWGSLPLAIRAGVDFPYLLYKMEMGESFESVFDYKIGVKQRNILPYDILWFLETGKLLEFLKSFSISDDVLSVNDPLPAVGGIVNMFRLAKRRRML